MLQKYFSFSGRLNRKAYWLRSLMLFAVMLATMLLLFFAVGFGSAILDGDFAAISDTMEGAGAIIVGIAVFAVFVAVSIAGISLAARRLHDRDKSAWWLLVFYVLPSFLSGDTGLFGPPDGGLATVVSLIGAGISIWGLVEIGFLKGTEGPNRFGDDPLMQGGATADVFA